MKLLIVVTILNLSVANLPGSSQPEILANLLSWGQIVQNNFDHRPHTKLRVCKLQGSDNTKQKIKSAPVSSGTPGRSIQQMAVSLSLDSSCDRKIPS